MRRYKGADKPPGPTLSPPPYSRSSHTGRSNQVARSSHRSSTGRTTNTAADNDPFVIRGSAAPQAYLDPRTKQPTLMPIPQAGRSIPKLKIADLTTSLAPLVESQMIPDQPTPMNLADKRINKTMREMTTTKDLLESFDDAVNLPDFRAVNSKVARLRKEAGISAMPLPQPRLFNSESGSNTPKSKNASVSNTTPAPTAKKGSKRDMKSEEQNVRKLMAQLRDKYLEDMEGQLGLAVDRRSIKGLLDDGAEKDARAAGAVPKPSTNAAEITSRIDKVVKEWAYEAQKLSATSKVPSRKASASTNSPVSTKSKNSPKQPPKPAEPGPGAMVPSQPKPPGKAEEKNKNLAKISAAFKRNLDKYVSKKDVRELISIPDDDHVEKLEQDHEERRKAHESVFKHAITLDAKIPNPALGEVTEDEDVNNNVVQRQISNRNGPNKATPLKEKGQEAKKGMVAMSRNQPIVNVKGAVATGSNDERNKPKPSLIDSIKNANDDQDEVYSIIKEHMEYEMAAGPPKLSLTQRKGQPGQPLKKPIKKGESTDQFGRALAKFDSHRKLQSLVDSFSEKIDASAEKRPGPPERRIDKMADLEEERRRGEVDVDLSLVTSSIGSQASLSSRKNASIEVADTLSRSMKTIGKATNVAQRLGTLLSRVALRNEAYEREQKELEEAEKLRNELSPAETDINNNPFPPPPSDSHTAYSIKTMSSPSALQMNEYRKVNNPYVGEDELEEVAVTRRHNVPPGVSKLDSNQFGKYVEQIKLVAEKAAESFEKFKEMHIDNEDELQSFSEGEEGEGDEQPPQEYKGNKKAYAVAAAAAEIAKMQEEEERRKIARDIANRHQTQQRNQSRSGLNQFNPRNKETKTIEMGTSPRESLFRKLSSNRVSAEPEFKFVPDMSYTDQLMLQKLRKMKEKEGWGDSLNDKVSQLMEDMDGGVGTGVGDVPNQDDIESMIKKATDTELTKQTEQGGMGAAVSLNAILRARMSSGAGGETGAGPKKIQRN